MKKIVVVNGSPRSGWNTDELVRAAADGAKAEGAEIEFFDLYKLEKYTGCISCFGCKLAKNEGKCVYKDGLTPVLDAIREADGLIIGSPNYLGEISAGVRSLYERLIFQSLTYRKEQVSCNDRRIPVLFIMTSNTPEEYFDAAGVSELMKGYQMSLNTFVGSTKTFAVGNTLQVKDYSRYNWTMFDPETKKKRHDEVFPDECRKAYEFGAEMAGKAW